MKAKSLQSTTSILQGRGTNPNVDANGEYGSHAPIAIINNVVKVIGIDAMIGLDVGEVFQLGSQSLFAARISAVW